MFRLVKPLITSLMEREKGCVIFKILRTMSFSNCLVNFLVSIFYEFFHINSKLHVFVDQEFLQKYITNGL
jgi:hypothetical protein